MITRSESIKEISAALLIFHKEVDKIIKDATNPFFKSSYAPLPTVLEGIKEPLQTAKLVYTQFPVDTNGLTTLLMHPESGEYLEGTFYMTPAKNDPQGQGSVITYQRRYALGAILGLNIDNDDDGNQASGRANVDKVGPAKKEISAAKTMAELQNVFLKYDSLHKNKEFLDIIRQKKEELK